MKRSHIINMIIVLLVIMAVSGCGGQNEPEAPTASEPAQGATVAPEKEEAEPTEETEEEKATEDEEEIKSDEDSEEEESVAENEPEEAEEESSDMSIPLEEFEKLEEFDPDNFDESSTTIDNEWLPLTPGTQLIYEGVTIEEGEEIPHRVIFTVTDLTKMIGDVRVIVMWDQDYSDDELVEAEIAFFAQGKDGNVWHFGQYPEEYEDGELDATPGWIAGIEDAQVGITVKAEPEIGGASYSQGWGPAVDWTDRARAKGYEEEICVPAGCYENVLVTEEFSREEPDAFQLKYYASGVGNIGVGWVGDDPNQETLDLIEVVQLSEEELAEARTAALELEARAYENIPDVYSQTDPMSPSAE